MTRNVPLVEEIINDTMLVVWQKAILLMAVASCRPGFSPSPTGRR
jgi:hypothetical protein